MQDTTQLTQQVTMVKRPIWIWLASAFLLLDIISDLSLFIIHFGFKGFTQFPFFQIFFYIYLITALKLLTIISLLKWHRRVFLFHCFFSIAIILRDVVLFFYLGKNAIDETNILVWIVLLAMCSYLSILSKKKMLTQ